MNENVKKFNEEIVNEKMYYDTKCKNLINFLKSNIESPLFYNVCLSIKNIQLYIFYELNNNNDNILDLIPDEKFLSVAKEIELLLDKCKSIDLKCITNMAQFHYLFFDKDEKLKEGFELFETINDQKSDGSITIFEKIGSSKILLSRIWDMFIDKLTTFLPTKN